MKMDISKKILALRCIRVGFDVAIALLSLFVILMISMTVFDLSLDSDSAIGTILAKAVPESNNTGVKNIPLVSKRDSLTSTYSINDCNIVINMKYDKMSIAPIANKIIYVTALNLEMIFLLFVFIQAALIIKSLIRDMKARGNQITHSVFTDNNLKRFRYISYGFIAMPLIEIVLYFIDNNFLNTYFSLPGYKIPSLMSLSDVSWDYLLIGLLFFALIEMVRRGMAIQEENDLTV